MSLAIYPGSFDPPTLGHLDIIRRAASIFDEVKVCVMKTGAGPGAIFTPDERVYLISEITEDFDNVTVSAFGGLLTDYIKNFDNPIIIRGLRGIADFDYEFQMAQGNKKLNPEFETMFMIADSRYTFLSSSVVGALAKFSGKRSCFERTHHHHPAKRDRIHGMDT
jgi:pantetheine-phosphate adenylyltransferase